MYRMSRDWRHDCAVAPSVRVTAGEWRDVSRMPKSFDKGHYRVKSNKATSTAQTQDIL